MAARVRGSRSFAPPRRPDDTGPAPVVPGHPAEGRPELVEGLLAAGADVTAVEAYRTVPASAEAIRPLGAWISAGEVDAVAFASPSAVAAVVAGLGEEAPLLKRVVLAAIGPTTADALRAAGLEARAVPARHTGLDLADAIAAALGPRG